jgi:alpha-ribazole phosphatase
VDLRLVRHTSPRDPGVCYGARDVELADSFDVEAEGLLAQIGRPGRIVTSPLARCLRLAHFLAARAGAAVTVDPDWREMDFGAWEGRPWDALPRAELDAWVSDFMHARPHGGESVAMLLERTRRAIGRCRATGQPWLAVTHAGVIRAALADAGDTGAWQREIPFSEVITLTADTP